jgi:N-acetylmuramoyl-L-alanine amidase CwlA
MKKPKINKLLSKYNQQSRNGQAPKNIVMHYVGEVSSAKNNCIYFAGGDRRASAHFFCDSEIWQSIPLEKAAWHCGGGLQDYGTKTVGGNKGATLHGICTNNNSIGIELCCKKNVKGQIVPTKTAINTAIPLVQWLMQEYNIPASRVIRHFDVTGKCCPNGYISKKSWRKLHAKLTNDPVYPTKYLKKGNKGYEVGKLQYCLNVIDNAGLEEDESYGGLTEKAVKNFKRKHMGVKHPTHRVGKKTLAKIKELMP